MQTTPTGKIWVGYHDEGVFGNYGWGNPGGLSPLGGSGLVRWSSDGDSEYDFSPPDGYPSIADCYALNVVGEGAWACYDTDFPLAHVRSDDTVAAWIGEVAGAHALAVLDITQVGLVGGYHGLFDRLVTAELTGDHAAATQTFQLVSADGLDLPQHTRVFARGQKLHALTAGRWLMLDLTELPT